MRLTIAVAMTTYNGAAYVEEQLSSIGAQTRTPDTVVIYDDASVDGTPDIVRRCARDLRCPVDVRVNDSRVGAVANIERAIVGADADVIALCDQDDLWAPDRLARTERAFNGDDISAFFTDATLIDDTGLPTGERLWSVFGFDGRRLQRWAADPLGVLLQGNVVTGATLAFRAGLRDLILPLPALGWHDYWIGVLAAATGEIRAEPDPLISYRVHGTNATGIPQPRLRDELNRRLTESEARRETLAMFRSAAERLRQHGTGHAALPRFDAKVEHFEFRTSLPASLVHRTTMVSREALRGRYRAFSRGVHSAAFDIAFGGKG